MRTEQQVKPYETRSTGQGVGGNSESEGPQGKLVGPRKTNRLPALSLGDPLNPRGSRVRHDGGDVGDAGMWILGSHGDSGKPSVPRIATVRDAPGKGIRWPRTRAARSVDLVATRGRRNQGGRWSRSSDDARGNPERTNGSWSTKDCMEETNNVTFRKVTCYLLVCTPTSCVG